MMAGGTWLPPRRRLWLMLAVLWALLMFNPVNRLTLRAAWLAANAGLLGYALWRWRHARRLQAGLVVLLLAGGLWFTVGARPVTVAELRAEYIRACAGYDGVGYLWGGESRLGIDCSGLVRRGLIDAQLWLGLTNGNAPLLWQAAGWWWHDLSALALRDGESGATARVVANVTLNTLDYGQVQPGDIMVTANGVHCMVYLGDRIWIQADPTRGYVFREAAPSRSNSWYNSAAHIVRWREFSAL